MATTISLERHNEGGTGNPGGIIGGTVEQYSPPDPVGSPPIVTKGSWTCYTSSSSNAVSGRVFWWFDTSNIPDAAVITGVQFKARYSTVILDAFFSSITYLIANDVMGTTLDATDFDVSSGSIILTDFAPASSAFFDTALLTSAAILAQVSKTAYTNVYGFMSASDVTGSSATYSSPITWKAAIDPVPRLYVSYTYNNASFTVGIPGKLGTPTIVGTPTSVGTPNYLYNP